MTTTPNIGATHIAASANQKEVVANTAFDRFDSAITETYSADVSSGNATLTTAQAQQAVQVVATGATTARTVTLPAVQRFLILANSASATASVGFVRGSTTLAVAPGVQILAYIDGTANGLQVVKAPPQTSRLYIPVGDETTTLTTGTAKITFRMPFAMTVQSVRASLTTASSSGVVTVDINEAGSTILSTKLTIDQSEKTSTTAATPAVISDAALADDAEITIDIDGAGTNAAGLKVWLIGTEP